MAKQTFTSGQVLTAAEMNSLQENDYNWTVTTKTASYTLAAGDEGTRIVMNNAGATTITVDDAVFAAGDVVWIHNIGAGTCTITAGTATVNTDGSLALTQYQGGQLFFTSASSAIFFPNVGAQAGGKILQVVSTTKTDTFSVSLTAGSVADITGLSATITPTSATSKVLAIVNVTAGSTRTDGKANATFVLKRDSTQIGIADTASNRFRASATQLSWNLADGSSRANIAWNYLDSPATTSATTYQVEIANAFNSGTTETLYVNRGDVDTDYLGLPRSVSTITLLEVSA